MIYAVNKRTKEHRIHTPGYPSSLDEEFVEASPDGWIEWQGGECPLPDGVPCEYMMREHGSSRSEADSLRWNHLNVHTDIIAYRPILDADTKPEPPAWDGIETEDDLIALMNRIYPRWRDLDGYKALFESITGRPIRSEEEIAAEVEMYEASKMLRDAHLQGMRRDNEYDTCRALYRAGYRKHGD